MRHPVTCDVLRNRYFLICYKLLCPDVDIPEEDQREMLQVRNSVAETKGVSGQCECCLLHGSGTRPCACDVCSPCHVTGADLMAHRKSGRKMHVVLQP